MKPRIKPGAIGAAVLIAVPIVGLVSHPAIRQDLLAALASRGAASSTSAGSGAQVGAAAQSANLLPNGNFDTGSTSGWGGTNASLKAVSPGFGGLGYAAKVTRTAGTSYSMFAKSRPATSVPQAEGFQAAAEVSGVAGRSLCLLTREVTSGGSIVQTVKKCVTASGTWQALGPVTLTVQHSGNSVAYLIQQTGAKTGDSFLADSLSLADVTASPSPTPTTPSPTPTTPSPTPTTPSPTPTTPSPSPSVGTPCGQSAAPPAQYDHIYLFVFENLSYASFLADNLPYTHALAAACGLATNYSAITHPSLPNYLAMTSGDTQGITGDPAPTNPGSLTADNIFNEVTLSGGQWRSYSESMPQNCYHADDPPAPNAYYTVHHEPAVYYADIATACNNWDVPQGTTTSGAMISDINSGTMPTFAFVGPNDDGGCSTCGGDVDPQKLDSYLQAWLPQIFATPSYQAGKTAILIAWDESDNKTSNQVPMIAIAPSIPAGTQVSDPFNHYSLLRSMEEMLGIPNLLGNAATATSMRSAFNI